jgi:hypothetical protein
MLVPHNESLLVAAMFVVSGYVAVAGHQRPVVTAPSTLGR